MSSNPVLAVGHLGPWLMNSGGGVVKAKSSLGEVAKNSFSVNSALVDELMHISSPFQKLVTRTAWVQSNLTNQTLSLHFSR